MRKVSKFCPNHKQESDSIRYLARISKKSMHARLATRHSLLKNEQTISNTHTNRNPPPSGLVVLGHNTYYRIERVNRDNILHLKHPAKNESNNRLHPTHRHRLGARHRSGIQPPSHGQFKQRSLP